MRAHMGEHTCESTHMRAQWEHTCESTHVRARRFVRACAVDKHMDMSQEISQEPFCVEISRKMSDPPVNTSIKHRAFYCDRKNPFSVATLFGEKSSLAERRKRQALRNPREDLNRHGPWVYHSYLAYGKACSAII